MYVCVYRYIIIYYLLPSRMWCADKYLLLFNLIFCTRMWFQTGRTQSDCTLFFSSLSLSLSLPSLPSRSVKIFCILINTGKTGRPRSHPTSLLFLFPGLLSSSALSLREDAFCQQRKRPRSPGACPRPLSRSCDPSFSLGIYVRRMPSLVGWERKLFLLPLLSRTPVYCIMINSRRH